MPRSVPEKRRSSPAAPLYIVLGLVAVAGLAALATQVFGRKEQGATQPVAVTLTPEQLQRVPGISVGQPNAPITIFEFADFQCPHCGQWASFIEPVIKERLVDTGRARYVFYDFPLGGSFQHGFLASRAGRCANEQGKFWEYHDLLFARQQQWSYAKDAAGIFIDLAGEPSVGLDEDAFETCLRSDKYAKEVSESRELGIKLGVTGTPAVFVNGQRIQELPGSYSEFETQVRQIAPGAFGASAAEAPAAPAADTAPAAAGAQ